MDIESEIFKRNKINIDKLINYGFKKIDNKYVYEKEFNNNFKAVITIIDKKINGKVIDLSINEEYIGFRIKNQIGEFATKIKYEYENILKDILNNCFDKEYFIYNQSNRITKLINKKYNVNPEFLWNNAPGYGVFRNKASNKWFGIIMNIDKSKILKNNSGEIEVLNIKLGNVEEYLKIKGIYNSYHMSKKSWVSIILDDTLTDEEIMKLISISFDLSNN